MCCGDSALFQGVFIRQRTFWMLEDSVLLIFYLMNIFTIFKIFPASAFCQGHSTKFSTKFSSIEAYIDHWIQQPYSKLVEACGMPHAPCMVDSRESESIRILNPWLSSMRMILSRVDWALHRAVVGGCKQHTMGTVGPHANAKDRVGMRWLGGAFCGRHNGKICSK